MSKMKELEKNLTSYSLGHAGGQDESRTQAQGLRIGTQESSEGNIYA
jgi:hypothetical protein